MYPNWILFSEKIPPINQYILVTLLRNNERLVRGGCYSKGKLLATNLDSSALVCEELIAWCPIPKPYSE